MGLEDFRRYCESNNGFLEYEEQSIEHRKLVHAISSDPHRFVSGIGRIVKSYELVQFVDARKEDLSAIEIVFFTRNNEAAICQVKTSGYDPPKASSLTTQYHFVKNDFGLALKRISLQKNLSGRLTQEIIVPPLADLMNSSNLF